MRLCAWFWHHQLARGTHTPPVRGKHPACSRNCQAGLTAGTPCGALRGLSESPFLAVTLTVRTAPLGPEHLASETFPSLTGAHLQVSFPAPEPQQGTLCYHFRSGTPHPTPGIRLAFCNPGRKACPNLRTHPSPAPNPEDTREDAVSRRVWLGPGAKRPSGRALRAG